MTLVVKGIGWIALFVGVAIAALVFAVIGVSGPGTRVPHRVVRRTGFRRARADGPRVRAGGSFRAVAEPFGSDALVQFHRQIGLVGLVFVLVHVAISAPWDLVIRPFDADTPARVRWALLATIALFTLIGTSLGRRRLRLSYEFWHILHAVLAVTLIVAALMHALLVDYYLDALWKQVLWVAMSAAFATVLVWARIAKPLLLWGRPWTVERVTDERGQTTTLTLRADGHAGLDFVPGQYAWFAIQEITLTR